MDWARLFLVLGFLALAALLGWTGWDAKKSGIFSFQFIFERRKNPRVFEAACWVAFALSALGALYAAGVVFMRPW